MDLPLPHRLYLLSYDIPKARVDINSALVRGPLLRAAAVAELCLTGLLRHRERRVERVDDEVPASLDSFLAEVLDDVPPGRRRRWFGVIDQRWHKAEAIVRDRLVDAGLITSEMRRILCLIPNLRIGLPDPQPVLAMRDRVRAPVLGELDPETAPIEDLVLAAIAIAIEGHVSTVFWRRELRAHKSAARAVTDRVDRELPELRTALSWSIAARRTPASS